MLAAEQAFFNAVVAAEGVRQAAKSAAFAAYLFNPAGLVAYRTALSDADVAYQTAVTAALNTSNLPLGNLGMSGPLDVSNWCSLQGMA